MDRRTHTGSRMAFLPKPLIRSVPPASSGGPPGICSSTSRLAPVGSIGSRGGSFREGIPALAVAACPKSGRAQAMLGASCSEMVQPLSLGQKAGLRPVPSRQIVNRENRRNRMNRGNRENRESRIGRFFRKNRGNRRNRRKPNEPRKGNRENRIGRFCRILGIVRGESAWSLKATVALRFSAAGRGFCGCM